jgi:hypothetical protein
MSKKDGAPLIVLAAAGLGLIAVAIVSWLERIPWGVMD